MDLSITPTQGAAYVVAGGVAGTAFTALRHGTSPKVLLLGAATGLVSGSVQSMVQATTGSSELGWAAAAGTGAVAGAVLLGPLSRASGATPLAARGIGALIGAAGGVFAPIAAGIILAQIQKATGGGDKQAPGAPTPTGTTTDPA
jgi:hypothetical protein